MEDGRRQLIVVCSHRIEPGDVDRPEDRPRKLGGLAWVDDDGVVIMFAEKSGLAYRRTRVTGNRGRTSYETEDRTVIEVRCGRCGFEKDVRRQRLESCFDAGEPRADMFPPDARGVSRLDVSMLR